MDLNRASDPQAEARRLAQCVEKDPDRLGGELVFRGNRVPVKSLFDHLSAGDSLETFLDDFPGLTREHVQTVLELARLHLFGEVQTR
jgi:uncharacterized protein (DUF433 family)